LDGPNARDVSVVILDLVMPGLDGIGVLKAMRERGIHVPVIVQTAQGGIETVVAELMKELARHPRGTTSTFLCFGAASGNEDVTPNVVLRRCRTLASAPLSLAMARAYLAARKTADVVHVHVPNPWAVVLVLLFPPRGAIVVGAHAVSTRYGWLQAPHDWLMRALYRRSA
ncbi:MAG: glycosyltransferase, partial [Kiloniellaceae bacterium]|nr:glycosyltransferase [Kiloniellaceae bacterium]